MRKPVLLAATALTALAASHGGALAQDNNANIRFNLGGGEPGSVNSLTIVQDGVGGGNTIGTGTADGTAFSFRGPWNAVSITQTGAANSLTGNARAAAGSTNGNLTASFVGNNNTQTLAIGGTTAPLNPQISINVTGSMNTLSDTLNGTALSLTRTVTGASNMITNDVAAVGSITINEVLQGDMNVITRSLAGVNSLNALALVRGSNNTLSTEGAFSGDLTAVQAIGVANVDPASVTASTPLTRQGSNNTLAINASGSGTAVVRQVLVGGPVPAQSSDDNALTANLTGVSGSTTVVQWLNAGGQADENVLTANLSSSNQNVRMVVERGAVEVDGVQPRGNTFIVTSAGASNVVDATWRGGFGSINISQTATAADASVNWQGNGATTVAPVAATVNITQTGAGNAFVGVTTANPGQVANVNITQN